MTEPSSKSEVCPKCQSPMQNHDDTKCELRYATPCPICQLPSGGHITRKHTGIPVSSAKYVQPQPPVSAPEKCETCNGLGSIQISCPSKKWGCAVYHGKPCPDCHSEPDSAQPTPSEGPYHPAMDRLSVKFGPDEFQVKFSSPETVGTECILMNMGFAQGQASSAKEVEVYRKALEVNANRDHGFRCTYAAGKYSGTVPKCTCGKAEAMEALLTSKPEPVAPVRKREAEDEI